jgi:hypothetical protein
MWINVEYIPPLLANFCFQRIYCNLHALLRCALVRYCEIVLHRYHGWFFINFGEKLYHLSAVCLKLVSLWKEQIMETLNTESPVCCVLVTLPLQGMEQFVECFPQSVFCEVSLSRQRDSLWNALPIFSLHKKGQSLQCSTKFLSLHRLLVGLLNMSYSWFHKL